jgi:hypothetical protein
METMHLGDQDYIVGNPIDFMVNGIKKTGILKYNRGTFFTHEGFVIKSDVTYDLNKLPPGFKFLNSRDKTDRMKAIETKKLEREQQAQKYAEEQAAEVKRRELKYAEETERKRLQDILDEERRKKESLERHERNKIEKKKKEESEALEDAKLNAQIETGIKTTDTKIDDIVKYNDENATVIGQYFQIRYKDGREDIVNNSMLMNISAAQREKEVVMIKRNPSRNIYDGYQFSGGTRRRKNRKTKIR